MKITTTSCNSKHKLYGLLMMMALLWLTVSTPFVYAQQQAAKQSIEANALDTGDDTDPLNSTTEEQSESGGNTLQEEYLHDAHLIEHHFVTLPAYYKCHSSDLYFAYHPDTISPPPDFFA